MTQRVPGQTAPLSTCLQPPIRAFSKFARCCASASSLSLLAWQIPLPRRTSSLLQSTFFLPFRSLRTPSSAPQIKPPIHPKRPRCLTTSPYVPPPPPPNPISSPGGPEKDPQANTLPDQPTTLIPSARLQRPGRLPPVPAAPGCSLGLLRPTPGPGLLPSAARLPAPAAGLLRPAARADVLPAPAGLSAAAGLLRGRPRELPWRLGGWRYLRWYHGCVRLLLLLGYPVLNPIASETGLRITM